MKLILKILGGLVHEADRAVSVALENRIGIDVREVGELASPGVKQMEETGFGQILDACVTSTPPDGGAVRIHGPHLAAETDASAFARHHFRLAAAKVRDRGSDRVADRSDQAANVLRAAKHY